MNPAQHLVWLGTILIWAAVLLAPHNPNDRKGMHALEQVWEGLQHIVYGAVGTVLIWSIYYATSACIEP